KLGADITATNNAATGNRTCRMPSPRIGSPTASIGGLCGAASDRESSREVLVEFFGHFAVHLERFAIGFASNSKGIHTASRFFGLFARGVVIANRVFSWKLALFDRPPPPPCFRREHISPG